MTNPPLTYTHDVIIVGGGLIGVVLLLSLKVFGFRCKLIEYKQHPAVTNAENPDIQYLALSPASMTIFRMLGLWSLLEECTCAIEGIHISQQGSFGRARLRSTSEKPLGCVIGANTLLDALYKKIDPDDVLVPASLEAIDTANGHITLSHNDNTVLLQAPLIIAADGAESTARKLCQLTATTKHYPQHAVVTTIDLRRSHQHWALERFTSHGPLALLPIGDQRASLVWALPPQQARLLKDLPSDAFLKRLQTAAGYKLGRFTQVGPRAIYPLKQVVMEQQTKDRVIFIGNAAHTLHPVAGQGFNLGLRDIATLVECIVEGGLNKNMITSYINQRRIDHLAITTFTASLVDLFTSKIPGLPLIRSAGLVAFDNLPSLKNILAQYLRGYAGTPPKLACGIALSTPNN